jgi:hypothetical protein
MKRKILLFCYVGGAGGKFIANCLAFSKQVAYADYNIAKTIIQDNNLELLENQLFNNIPEKQHSRQWLNLEVGCKDLFGEDIVEARWGIRQEKLRLNDLSVFNDIWLPLMNHQVKEVRNCQNFFADDELFTVLVKGTPEFIDLAIRLKWPEKHHCLNLNIYKEFNKEIENQPFDFTFENWDPRNPENLNQIPKLANQLGIELDLNLAKNYIKKYIDFHLD